MDKYIVWTDGSYKSSIDAGGYSSIITIDEKIITKLYQGFKSTTNNRMELMGVLETLKYFNTPTNLHIYSDSQYVVSSINNNYVYQIFFIISFWNSNWRACIGWFYKYRII